MKRTLALLAILAILFLGLVAVGRATTPVEGAACAEAVAPTLTAAEAATESCATSDKVTLQLKWDT